MVWSGFQVESSVVAFDVGGRMVFVVNVGVSWCEEGASSGVGVVGRVGSECCFGCCRLCGGCFV